MAVTCALLITKVVQALERIWLPQHPKEVEGIRKNFQIGSNCFLFCFGVLRNENYVQYDFFNVMVFCLLLTSYFDIASGL